MGNRAIAMALMAACFFFATLTVALSFLDLGGMERAQRVTLLVLSMPVLLVLVVSVTDRTIDQIRASAYESGHCRRCGYDLRASIQRCSECGEAFARAAGD